MEFITRKWTMASYYRFRWTYYIYKSLCFFLSV